MGVAARATVETVRHMRQWPRCAAQVGVGVRSGLGRELGLGLRGRRYKDRRTFAHRRWCRGAVREGVQLSERASACRRKGSASAAPSRRRAGERREQVGRAG